MSVDAKTLKQIAEIRDGIGVAIAGVDSRIAASVLLGYASTLLASLRAIGVYEQVDIDALFAHALAGTEEDPETLPEVRGPGTETPSKLN